MTGLCLPRGRITSSLTSNPQVFKIFILSNYFLSMNVSVTEAKFKSILTSTFRKIESFPERLIDFFIYLSGDQIKNISLI